METIYEILRIKQEVDVAALESDFGTVNNPITLAEIATHFIGQDDREVLLVICLNTKGRVIAVHRAHVGSLNASIVEPREIFKAAILNNSACIAVAHQHPSTDCTPSNEDIKVTKRLMECGRILGIEVIDHVIVNIKGDFVSLKTRGLI